METKEIANIAEHTSVDADIQAKVAESYLNSMLDRDQCTNDSSTILSTDIHSDDPEEIKIKKRNSEKLTERMRAEKVEEDQAIEASLLEEEERKKNNPKKRPFEDSDSEKEEELRKRFEYLKKREERERK